MAPLESIVAVTAQVAALKGAGTVFPVSPVTTRETLTPPLLASTVAEFASTAIPANALNAVAPVSPLAPCGPWTPASPLAPGGPWAPVVNCPALKSCDSSEPFFTFDELIALLLIFEAITAFFLICAMPVERLGSERARRARSADRRRRARRTAAERQAEARLRARAAPERPAALRSHRRRHALRRAAGRRMDHGTAVRVNRVVHELSGRRRQGV